MDICRLSSLVHRRGGGFFITSQTFANALSGKRIRDDENDVAFLNFNSESAGLKTKGPAIIEGDRALTNLQRMQNALKEFNSQHALRNKQISHLRRYSILSWNASLYLDNSMKL